jgi:hypothetical protein
LSFSKKFFHPGWCHWTIENRQHVHIPENQNGDTALLFFGEIFLPQDPS